MDKNLQFQKFDIRQIEHARLKNQKPICLWMTGLSGSGKTTIANALEKALYKMDKHTCILDGDKLRLGLNSDLNFRNFFFLVSNRPSSSAISSTVLQKSYKIEHFLKVSLDKKNPA
mgnify:CR=1 FL=1